MTPKDWVAKVHGLAREKGWWGEVPDTSPKSVMAKFALIVSELMEALELVREPGFDATAIWGEGVQGTRVSYEAMNKEHKLPKPEGFGVELADAVIRVFDLAGACAYELTLKGDFFEKTRAKHLKPIAKDLDADDVLQTIMRIVTMVSKASDIVDDDEHQDPAYHPHRVNLIEGWLTSAVIATTVLASVMGCDIEALIATKHAYNETRPARHGGKRA